MAKFIPIGKIKKLREDSKNGDERAKKILSMQLEGKEDFSPLLDEYFKPEPEPEVQIEPAVVEENINEAAEVEEHCECECKELLKKLMKEESEAIQSYDKGIAQTMNSEELDEGQKRKIISRLKEIRSDEEEHFSELKELLGVCEHNEEEIAQ